MRGVSAAIVVGLALGPAARADDASEVEAAAQVHLDRGIAAFERGDYAGAHRELRAANELVPAKPNPYRWLALTEVQLGDCAAARANIDAFLARVGEDDARRAEMLRLQDLCSRTGSLAIRTTPERAQLRIDGAHVGTAPYRAGALAAGTHTVVADAPGYEALSRSLVVAPGGALDVHLRLERRAGPVYRRWWFVPAVVGAAAVVTGAIVLATRDDGGGTPTLPGLVCDASGCRPGGGS